MDVYLTGVHLTGVYLTGVYLTGMYLTGVHLIGVYLTGIIVKFGVVGAVSVPTTWVIDDMVKSDEVSIIE